MARLLKKRTAKDHKRKAERLWNRAEDISAKKSKRAVSKYMQKDHPQYATYHGENIKDIRAKADKSLRVKLLRKKASRQISKSAKKQR